MPEQSKQSILLEDKSYLKVTGVKGVVNLTDTTASIIVNDKILEIKGNSLKAERLSVDCKEFILTGNIYSLKYQDKNDKKSLFKRIFK